jgi:AraC-like DNA-binding protein
MAVALESVVSRPVPVAAWLGRVAEDYRAGERTPLHVHDRPQLLYAESGVTRLHTEQGDWVVPPSRAVWIPEGIVHQVVMRSAVAMRSLYFGVGSVAAAPAAPMVIAVSPLLRELILEACRLAPEPAPGRPAERLIEVLIDQLDFEHVLPVHLPQPRSDPMSRAAQIMEESIADEVPLAAVASAVGFSLRHFARQFRAETRMPPAAWRQQLRLLQALELLALGANVTETALGVGYQSPSAFIAAFRTHFGTSPAAYFRTPKS